MVDAFLRIPPFPGHRAGPLATPADVAIDDAMASKLVKLLRQERVGANFWGGQPSLPQGRGLLLVPRSQDQAIAMVDAARSEDVLDQTVMIAPDSARHLKLGIPQLDGNLDWWELAEKADRIWVDADHEVALIGALAGRGVRTFGEGRFQQAADPHALMDMIRAAVGGWRYWNPFTDQPASPIDVVELLAGWRRLIDRNRSLSAIFGVAGWKRPTVDAMLWGGAGSPRYSANVTDASAENQFVAAWKSRTSAEVLERLLGAHVPVAEIEDGMIRGRGLGANCIPPLSIVVDFSGIYFDPNQPSDLETMLQTAEFDQALLTRAAMLRQKVVEAGISKYGGGSTPKVRSAKEHRILVVGQVEDDRSILSGGAGQTNLGLLQRSREIAPDAWVIYRPHPDVEAGHRKGHVADDLALQFADEVERGGSISTLIETIDELHCITSLAGFEALLRGKKVTTHGAPFYAGWGLTTDLGAIPPRRSRRRSLDELVAAALIAYPTYIDPVTRLPCPPEIVVDRIAGGEEAVAAPLSGLRIFQGKLKVALRRLREAAA